MDFNLINIKLTTHKFQFLSQRNLHSLKDENWSFRIFQHKEKFAITRNDFSFETILIFIAVLWRKTQIKEFLCVCSLFWFIKRSYKIHEMMSRLHKSLQIIVICRTDEQSKANKFTLNSMSMQCMMKVFS